MIATLHQCAYHDTLQAIGWFDGLVFTAPVNDKLRPLLDAASEKYGCEGAELLERLCVVAMGGNDVDVR
jgi:hypothetical protein